MRTPVFIITIGLVAGFALGAVGCGAPEEQPTGEPVELIDAGAEGIQVTHVPHYRGGTVFCVLVDRGDSGRGAGITCDWTSYYQFGSSQ